jgi:hypothetical protein
MSEGGKATPKGKRSWKTLHATLCQHILIFHQMKYQVRVLIRAAEDMRRRVRIMSLSYHLQRHLSAMQPYMTSDMTQNVYDALTMRHALAR